MRPREVGGSSPKRSRYSLTSASRFERSRTTRWPPRAGIEFLDRELSGKRYQCELLQAHLEDLQEKVEAIRIHVQQEPEGVRWEFFWSRLKEARTLGFKPGYPSAKYKERYGEWPPSHWRDRAMQEFAADSRWQSRNKIRDDDGDDGGGSSPNRPF